MYTNDDDDDLINEIDQNLVALIHGTYFIWYKYVRTLGGISAIRPVQGIC